MKKKTKRAILAGIVTLSAALLFTACGKKNTADKAVGTTAKQDTEAEPPAVTAVPDTPTPTPGALVDMKKAEKDEYADITNILGKKTAGAYRIPITNQTGGEIAEIYIRPKDEYGTEDWGEDLVKGSFTLDDQEKALYYFDKNQKDEDGQAITSYDVRIVFLDERGDCFFRDLPLPMMKELRLCMEGVGEDGIPYARYTLEANGSEQSTLEDVKKRLYGDDEEEEEEQAEQLHQEETEDATPTPAPIVTPEVPEATPTPVPEDTQEAEPTPEPEVPEEPYVDESTRAAENYVGQPLEALISAMGDPGSNEYQQEETGNTGYHYYDTFTVATSVDENGNETITAIW